MHLGKAGVSTGAILALGLVLAAPGSAKAVKGDSAPDFSGTALDGRKVTLSSYRGKGPAVVTFYAGFAPACREVFPRLKELDERLGAKGLKVLSVSMDEDRQSAAGLPNQAKVKFPVLFDPKGAIAEKYGVQAIPHTVVISREGKVQQVITGVDLDLLERSVGEAMK